MRPAEENENMGAKFLYPGMRHSLNPFESRLLLGAGSLIIGILSRQKIETFRSV